MIFQVKLNSRVNKICTVIVWYACFNGHFAQKQQLLLKALSSYCQQNLCDNPLKDIIT